jgi:hypothetical protein
MSILHFLNTQSCFALLSKTKALAFVEICNQNCCANPSHDLIGILISMIKKRKLHYLFYSLLVLSPTNLSFSGASFQTRAFFLIFTVQYSFSNLLFVGVITNKLNWRSHPAHDLSKFSFMINNSKKPNSLLVRCLKFYSCLFFNFYGSLILKFTLCWCYHQQTCLSLARVFKLVPFF